MEMKCQIRGGGHTHTHDKRGVSLMLDNQMKPKFRGIVDDVSHPTRELLQVVDREKTYIHDNVIMMISQINRIVMHFNFLAWHGNL